MNTIEQLYKGCVRSCMGYSACARGPEWLLNIFAAKNIEKSQHPRQLAVNF